MKRSQRVLIAVIALLALSGAYLLVRAVPEKDEAENAAAAEAPAVKLIDVEKDDIRKMTLEQEDSSITFVRDGETWKAEYPYPLKLNVSAVEGLLESFADLTAVRSIVESPDDLAQFGLAPPEVKASVETADGSVQTVLVGKQLPSGYNFYMMKNGGSTVYSVGGSKGYYFKYTLSDFREKALAENVDYQKLETLYLKNAEGVIEVAGKKDGEAFYNDVLGAYKLVKPYRHEYGVDADKFGKFVQSLPQFRIDDFVDDAPKDLAKYGLADPAAELQVRDADGASIHLYFGKRKDDLSRYAKLDGEKKVFTLAESDLGFLGTDAFDLVGKFACIIDITQVDRIEIATRDRTYVSTITHEAAAEAGEKPVEHFFFEGKEVEDKAFREYYQELIGMVVDGENPSPAQGRPVLTISYFLNGKAARDKVSVAFVPFNRDFYQVFSDGVSSFVISRDQVNAVIEKTAGFMKDTAQS